MIRLAEANSTLREFALVLALSSHRVEIPTLNAKIAKGSVANGFQDVVPTEFQRMIEVHERQNPSGELSTRLTPFRTMWTVVAVSRPFQ